MKAVFIRHSITKGNSLRKYIGRTDEPLCPEGIIKARDFGSITGVKKVYITKYIRTKETAEIIFPDAKWEIVPGLEEMDMGDFEGRSADEMADDKAYRAWVDAMCIPPCPNGESMEGFTERVCNAFTNLLEKAEEEILYFVVHGGTIMSLFSSFGRAGKEYFDYALKNCCGIVCDITKDEKGIAFINEVTITCKDELKEAIHEGTV